MEKFLLTVSNIKISAKPSTVKDRSKIRYSCRHKLSLNFSELKELVLGYTFCTSNMNVIDGESISNHHFVSQQIFAIDMDKNQDINKFLEFCSKYNFEPNIIYNSFSDTSEYRKWRAIWVLDESINDYDYAKFLRESLISLIGGFFGEDGPDKSCKDASRMFFPGKEILYSNEDVMNVEYFQSVLESWVVSNDSMSNRKVLKNRKSYSNNIGSAVFEQNTDPLRDYDFDEACKEIKILDTFFNSEYKLDYNQMVGLATNLQYIEGGLLNMKNRMDYINSIGGGKSLVKSDGDKLFKYEPQHYALLKISKNGYSPMMISNFSPFKEDHKYHNLLDLRNFKWGRVDIIKKENLITLQQAEKDMKKEFEQIIEEIKNPKDIFNIEPNIYILKVSTGIGKTRLLEDVTGALLAFPTNNLKNEVSDRMRIDHSVTPSYPKFSDEELNEKLNNLHSCGLYTLSSNIIKEISESKTKSKSKYELTDDDIKLAIDYISINEICRITKDTVLTTHTRAIFDKSFNHDFIIFDEDPLNFMIEVGQANLKFSEFDNTNLSKTIKPIELYYRDKVGEMYIDDNKQFDISSKFQEYCAEIKRPDIIKLLDSRFIYKDVEDKGIIKFCKVNPLPIDKPIIIMSATAPVEIYKKLYPNRVKVIDLTNIQQTGDVVQFTGRGYSSSSLSKYKKDGIINDVKNDLIKEIGGSPVITHLKHRDIFKNNFSPYYFGNCSGGDTLNGQDIAIIGTPNKPQYVYYFYAKICGIILKASDNQISERVIEWNGFKFKFLTYENSDLRDIQLGLIESDLLQAVGRNRTLRNKCTAKVFSNIPLKVSTKFIQ